MRLQELIKDLRCEEVCGNADLEISGLCTDADAVNAGDVFICYKGMNFDSHKEIEKAVTGGAVAIVCEQAPDSDVPYVLVADGRAAMAVLARTFYGYADKKLKLIAVTGTNGKTTTTYMLKSIFDKNQTKTGIIGTLGIAYGGIFISPALTTPDPLFLHSVFADMVKCGVEYVFMEVSAHALYFDKIHGLHFEAGIFTNCTQDHLDFFKDMQSYAECKVKLFENGRCSHAVVNSDDPLGAELAVALPDCISYGLDNPADTFAIDVTEKIDGSSFVINLSDEIYEINLKMPALHNVYNALAAATCAKLLGVKIDVIAKGLEALEKVDGRLERVANYNGGEVFVDFAHTPDGLEKSLSALKKLCKGNLYCLFGCGGNRDTTKRPLMGEVAAKYSDFVIVTSDNPRYEDPYEIISQIETGVKKSGKKYVAVTDREIAIEYALNLLGQDDILLVAGKGGENYQEIMGIKHSYNDNTVIKKLIS
ncbi:MAG: UDP-N-acetylmuramoyl-L-alanyl-D-glutamate--2,6-diaminopimelate ligase [Clostridia bacterium]|nr:UDP-N-acetylmuramoyl-L-alanyl-D-glutamate--2,6-diaminopimelate ligase [Clostridia bacterium]